jgi:hypothetical protein
MSYPFVAAYWDTYGARKGPTLGIGLHMAEGGGTVGYLDKIGTIPPRGVSVHAVCDRAGVVTQMLKWGDASGSLNPADRSTEKGYYGHSVLLAVLGSWWTDPNSAIVSMEIEGYAAAGPNALQVPAVIAWGLDMRRMFTTIRGAFGHADQTDTKGCPGTTPAMKAIFAGLGGHGLFVKPPVVPVVAGDPPMHSFTTKPIGSAKFDAVPAHACVTLDGSPWDAGWKAGTNWTIYGEITLTPPLPGGLAGADRASALLVMPTTKHDGTPWMAAKPACILRMDTDWPAGKTAAPVAADTTPFTKADVDAAVAHDRTLAHITYG